MDIKLLGVYGHGWLVREVIAIDSISKEVVYRDYVLKSGAAIGSKSCSMKEMMHWAEREATQDESDMLDRQWQEVRSEQKRERLVKVLKTHRQSSTPTFMLSKNRSIKK
jgi:hypothetical protein